MSLVRLFMKRMKDAGQALQGQAESGQAIVIIAFLAIGLLAVLGLAIDGGRLLFVRRDTQNAADAAAIAAGRAMCQGNPNFLNIGLAAAETNGFDNRGLTSDRNGNEVAINAPPLNPSSPIRPECMGCYLEAVVTAEIPPSFIGIVYGGPLQATGKAISACNQHMFGESDSGLRALFSLSTGGQPCEVSVTGANITIEGGVHSNSHLKVNPKQGGGHIYGPASYFGSSAVSKVTFHPGSGSGDHETIAGLCEPSCFSNMNNGGGSGEEGCDVPRSDGAYQTCDAQPDPLAYNLADFAPGGQYANVAASKGQYFTLFDNKCQKKTVEDWFNSNRVGGSLKDGLYYTNCEVELNQNQLTGNITLVTEDSVQVSGGSQGLQPYMLDLLIFANGGANKCSAKTVKFSGSSNNWQGNIYAPHGQVDFSGSKNSTVQGCIVGYSVDFSGSQNAIRCKATDPDTNPGLLIIE